LRADKTLKQKPPSFRLDFASEKLLVMVGV